LPFAAFKVGLPFQDDRAFVPGSCFFRGREFGRWFDDVDDILADSALKLGPVAQDLVLIDPLALAAFVAASLDHAGLLGSRKNRSVFALLDNTKNNCFQRLQDETRLQIMKIVFILRSK
jgi:hypothetical protein